MYTHVRINIRLFYVNGCCKIGLCKVYFYMLETVFAPEAALGQGQEAEYRTVAGRDFSHYTGSCGRCHFRQNM